MSSIIDNITLTIGILGLFYFGNIIDCVHDCVLQYFITFRYCWTVVLYYFSSMINNYIDFLKILVIKILEWPTCLICFIGLLFSLYFANVIFKEFIQFLAQEFKINKKFRVL
jgi:hypothetical protein